MFDLGTAIGYLELDASGVMSGTKSALSEFKKLGNESFTLQMKVESLGKGFKSAGAMATKYLTLPLVGLGTTAVATASSFESAMSDISAATSGSEKEMDKFRTTLENLYSDGMGEGFEDLAAAISEVNSQMYDLPQEELEAVTKSAIALRDTFGYDIKESIRAVNALMYNFGLTSEEAFDLIVRGAQNGLDYSGEMIDTIIEYSVQFEKLGLTAEDMFRILQNGADSGAWNLDKIGDAIKEFSIRAIDGSESTMLAFKKLGFSYEETATKLASGGEDARQAFQEVVDALISMEDPLQRDAAGVALFGTMWEDLGPEVISQLAEIENASYNASGAMDELIEKKYDNLSGDLNMLTREATLMAAEFGELLLPYIRELVQWFTDLFEWIGNLDDGTKDIIVRIGLFVAAIGPVITILGNIISLISAIGPIVAALVNPFTLAVAAILGFAYAWETNLFGIKDLIQSFVDWCITSFTTFIEWMIESFNSFFENIVLYVSEFLQSIFDKIVEYATNIYTAGVNLWNSFWNGLKSLVNSIIQWVSSFVQSIVDTVLSFVSDMYNAGVSIFTGLWDGLKSVWDGIVSWVNGCIEWINDKLDEWFSASDQMSGGDDRPSRSGRKSHASGIDYVPRDNYPTVLHEGERVLTKRENEEYKNGNKSNGNTFIFYSNESIDEVKAAQEFKRVEKELAVGV